MTLLETLLRLMLAEARMINILDELLQTEGD